MDIPPLRERVEDIPTLAMHFLQRACTRLGITQPVLKQRHVMELQSYDWPGNIRELQNVIERAVITAGSRGLRFDLQVSTPEKNNTNGPSPRDNVQNDVLTDEEVREFERANIVRALQRTDWKAGGTGGAADVLGGL